MENIIRQHLEDTFEDLGAEKLRKFKIKLRDRKPQNEEPVVRQATIERIEDALDLVHLMVNTFTSKGAVHVTLELLTAIKENKLAEDLKEKTRDLAPVVPQPGPSAPSNVAPVVPQPDPSALSNAEDFIDKNKIKLINRVHKVDPILDELLQEEVITDEDYSDIRALKTPQEKMRALLLIIKAVGSKGKYLLYEALKKSNVMLMQDLGAL